MKIELNFTKKHLYFGAILLTLFTGVILVRSYDPAQGWHTSSQIDYSGGIFSTNIELDNWLRVNGVELRGTEGRNYFYDQESTTNKLRVGNAWGKSGIFAENGNLVIGASSGKVNVGDPAANNDLVVTGEFTVDDSGRYINAPTFSGGGASPPVADCNEASELGRMVFDRTLTYLDGDVVMWVCLKIGIPEWTKVRLDRG